MSPSRGRRRIALHFGIVLSLVWAAIVAGSADQAAASATSIPTGLRDLSAVFDNVGISAAGAPGSANLDGSGHSLVAEDLVAAGWDGGRAVTVDGAPLRFPAFAPGRPDNVVADGQRVRGGFVGAALSFLVTSTGTATTGTGAIAYADGHVQSYELGAPDWFFGPGDRMTVSFPRWNTPDGPSPFSAKLYTVSIPLAPGIPVKAITLPKISSGGSAPSLHVFALGVRPGAGPWTATWTTATDDGLAAGPWTDRTLRMVEHTSRGGLGMRIRLDNAYDPGPLLVGHATIAVQREGSTPVSTPVTVTFGGRREVGLPAGGQAVSDPVPFFVPADANLLVSLYLKGTVRNAPAHSVALQDMYTTADGSGDHAADRGDFPSTGTFAFWTVLAGIDVAGPVLTGSVVAFGDSITDGYSSTPGTNSRWPDFLARRVLASKRFFAPGVVNEGISANKILQDQFSGFPDGRTGGVSGLARLNHDLISQPGVRTAIVLEGINDVNAGTQATDVIAGLTRIAAELHAARVRVLVGTLTPIKGCSCATDGHMAARDQVNAFIRNNAGVFDGWIDFDAAVRDPGDPEAMLPVYDSGDHLHPSDAGYRVMANAIRLDAL
ncbi:GDSL-type esterase/lipase family protein [Amycolatopsis pigmentata]|uniref:GDSL-type esterase/lipase family protein n=1 Tax=Amycolatopsis pigmentata TaxID=450801 RepID=A0ABW5FPA9_9PSEU